jgi:hypothetical protein
MTTIKPLTYVWKGKGGVPYFVITSTTFTSSGLSLRSNVCSSVNFSAHSSSGTSGILLLFSSSSLSWVSCYTHGHARHVDR